MFNSNSNLTTEFHQIFNSTTEGDNILISEYIPSTNINPSDLNIFSNNQDNTGNSSNYLLSSLYNTPSPIYNDINDELNNNSTNYDVITNTKKDVLLGDCYIYNSINYSQSPRLYSDEDMEKFEELPHLKSTRNRDKRDVIFKMKIHGILYKIRYRNTILKELKITEKDIIHAIEIKIDYQNGIIPSKYEKKVFCNRIHHKVYLYDCVNICKPSTRPFIHVHINKTCSTCIERNQKNKKKHCS